MSDGTSEQDKQEKVPESLFLENSELDFSKSVTSVRQNNDSPKIYSSNLSVEVSDSDSDDDQNELEEVKTESFKSIWSNDSKPRNSKLPSCILPSTVDPFTYDGRIIYYNVDRGVNYNTPVYWGTRKATGCDGEDGYHASHLVFNPKLATLAAGRDVNNAWSKLPKYSLISGLGNAADLDGSFLSGYDNKIIHDGPPEPKDAHPCIPPSCSIVGGHHNRITNTENHGSTSSIIACSNIELKNCSNTVALAMNSSPVTLEDYKEAVVTKNLYGLNRVSAGLPVEGADEMDSVFIANGNGHVFGNLDVKENLTAQSGTFTKLAVENAMIQNLTVTNLERSDLYLDGNNGVLLTHYISPLDSVDIVYVNPHNGPVNIVLGAENGANNYFQANRTITFKDISLEFTQNNQSPYSINILSPNTEEGAIPVRIEHYTPEVLGQSPQLTVGTNSSYSLNTYGGSVTFTYLTRPIPGFSPTWVITNQFIGNKRVLAPDVLKFAPATEAVKDKLFHRA